MTIAVVTAGAASCSVSLPLFEVNAVSLATISMCADAMTPGSAGQQRNRLAEATNQKFRPIGRRQAREAEPAAKIIANHVRNAMDDILDKRLGEQPAEPPIPSELGTV